MKLALAASLLLAPALARSAGLGPVVVDHHGCIRQVLTHDRALAAATPAKVEAFVRANADLFGIDPDHPASAPVSRAGLRRPALSD